MQSEDARTILPQNLTAAVSSGEVRAWGIPGHPFCFRQKLHEHWTNETLSKSLTRAARLMVLAKSARTKVYRAAGRRRRKWFPGSNSKTIMGFQAEQAQIIQLVCQLRRERWLSPFIKESMLIDGQGLSHLRLDRPEGRPLNCMPLSLSHHSDDIETWAIPLQDLRQCTDIRRRKANGPLSQFVSVPAVLDTAGVQSSGYRAVRWIILWNALTVHSNNLFPL